MVHLFNKLYEKGILVSGISTVWKDTDGHTKQYRCDIYIYFATILSPLYEIIIYHAINAPGHGNDVFNVLNDTNKNI